MSLLVDGKRELKRKLKKTLNDQKIREFFSIDDVKALKKLIRSDNKNNKNALNIKRIMVRAKRTPLVYDTLRELLNYVNTNSCIYTDFSVFKR